VESCREAAAAECDEILRVLAEALPADRPDATAARLRAPVVATFMLTADGEASSFDSTLGRELAFSVHHAVHHHATIAAIAKHLEVAVPDGFGLAPSTQHHHLD